MYKFFIYPIAIFLSISIAHAAEDATIQLLGFLSPIHNLAGNFDQKSMDKSGKLIQQQNGNFVVQKNGKFIWRIMPPYEQHIISDGKIINIYDPDLEQLTIKSLDEKIQIIPLLLFSEGGQQIIRQYDVTMVATNSDAEVAFELKPRQSGSLFDKLVIVFSSIRSRYIPTQLEILDSLKQTTQVHFDKVLLNQPVDQKLFEFSTPTGVDIIDERR